MSIIHVTQIKTHLERQFSGRIDMTDQGSTGTTNWEDHFLSRALAAHAVHLLSGCTVDDAAHSVTDGSDDNGIDAIYCEPAAKKLYFVQSKWIKSGSGEPSNGDIKKFVGGIHDLFSLEFTRFNSKIQARAALITSALADPATRYEVVVAYTGASSLAAPSDRDLRDLADELNDVSEVVFVTVLNQAELHRSLTAGVAGDPIDLQIGLKSWGRKDGPVEAFYGQVAAQDIVTWWGKYRTRLFSRNLRSTLGDTDVNTEMRNTLEHEPTSFWYYNNGVTLLTRTVSRAMIGGAGNDFGMFYCADVSVVNGAQTVSTIGRYGSSNPAAIADVYVPLRIIAKGGDDRFAEEVTRTNNRQNRIDSRDFVTLDPEQSRIRTELAIDGIDYQFIRSDSVVRTDTSFDLVEATTALACASGTIRLPVQLKREIGRLWEDISKAPYKELFNPSVPGLQVWRCVHTQRRIDKAIDGYLKRSGRSGDLKLVIHGNRLTAALVFEALPVRRFGEPAYEPATELTDTFIAGLVDARFVALSGALQAHYPNAMIPTLFKNLKKCEHLAAEVRKAV